ncbi:hypothetical protein pb186bvf_008736 [Paramecium bursaria]
MKRNFIEDYKPDKYEQQTKLLSIKLISIPTVKYFEQYEDILLGYIDKKYQLWRICGGKLNEVCTIQNEQEYKQVCLIWRQQDQNLILIIDILQVQVFNPKSQLVIHQFNNYLKMQDLPIRYFNFQQFKQSQFICNTQENRIELRKLQNKQISQQLILKNAIRNLVTSTYSQYIDQELNIVIRLNWSNKIYRKFQGQLKEQHIREPYSISRRVNGYKGYTCRVVDIRDMKLKLQFCCQSEDYKDSLFIKEKNLILILNEYSLWIFSSIDMRLLDVEQFPINKVSIDEPWKLSYRQECLEIFCQKYSMNQFYRQNQT